MTQAIWKFSLPIANHFTIVMPLDAVVLSVDVQYDEPVMWALCDTDDANNVSLRAFFGVGTGHPITFDPEHARFVGTMVLQGGAFVYHVYEDVS